MMLWVQVGERSTRTVYFQIIFHVLYANAEGGEDLGLLSPNFWGCEPERSCISEDTFLWADFAPLYGKGEAAF